MNAPRTYCSTMHFTYNVKLVQFNLTHLAVPWLRRLVARFLSRRIGFDRPFHMKFMVDKMPIKEVLLPSTTVFSCQYHSASIPHNFIYTQLLQAGQTGEN